MQVPQQTVATVSTPTVVVNTAAASPEISTASQNGDSNQDLQKQRVRRVACTCPNCSDGNSILFLFYLVKLGVFKSVFILIGI